MPPGAVRCAVGVDRGPANGVLVWLRANQRVTAVGRHPYEIAPDPFQPPVRTLSVRCHATVVADVLAEGGVSWHGGLDIVQAQPTHSQATDSQLIEAVAAGDRSALSDLYDRYAGLMLAVGLKMLNDRREAEDVLHDVFLEVWRSARSFDADRGSARTWILMRMRSRCLDRRRRTRRAYELTDDSEPQTPEDPSAAVDRARVRAALGTLNEAQRQVIELGYFGGLSSTEIAEQTGTPVGTVKSRVAAALSKLRAGLQDGGLP